MSGGRISRGDYEEMGLFLNSNTFEMGSFYWNPETGALTRVVKNLEWGRFDSYIEYLLPVV